MGDTCPAHGKRIFLTRDGAKTAIRIKDIRQVLVMLGIDATQQQVKWMEQVQASQDSGALWGYAIASGDRCHPLP